MKAEKDLFIHLDVADLEQKRPFYYDVAERKPFTFTTDSARSSMQIHLLTILLRKGGRLWTLEEYGTQVGVLTGHSASIAHFNWSASYISFS